MKTVDEAALWSVKYDDYYPKPDPFPVAAGTRYQLVVRLQPDCDNRDPIPVVTVTSRGEDGTTFHDTYKPKDVDAYLASVDEFCRPRPPSVTVGVPHEEPDGDFIFEVYVGNPTDEPMEVRTDAYSYRGTTYEAGSMTVPPHGEQGLELAGHGEACSYTNPTTTGHLYLNGTVFRLPNDGGVSYDLC
ncbi:hypothetical protein [Nocardioides sp. HB32]